MTIKHAVTETAGDGIGWLLLALGVTFSPHEYFGGLFFALACAMLVRHWFPEKDKREIWVTLLVAFLVATIGAEIYQWQFQDPPVPVQVAMAGLGLGSRLLVTLLMKLLFRAEQRSDEIADRVIDAKLPRRETK
jgi:hypothetical protein